MPILMQPDVQLVLEARMATRIVLLRHGQSQWNLENRFTGWEDLDLTKVGVQEACEAGQLLSEAGFKFDLAFTSVLKRAIRTLWIVLDQMELMWVPTQRTWKLNERHYGALTGLNKAETTKRYGDDQVFQWRRGYDVRPPAMEVTDLRHASHDRRYDGVDVPSSESLKDAMERVLPYWETTVKPYVADGRELLIVAHGNSLRALVKHLDDVPEHKITELNIPTGVPLVYEFDEFLRPTTHYYLGDPADIENKVRAVANQAKLD